MLMCREHIDNIFVPEVLKTVANLNVRQSFEDQFLGAVGYLIMKSLERRLQPKDGNMSVAPFKGKTKLICLFILGGRFFGTDSV